MKPPCDAAVIASGRPAVSYQPKSGAWILGVTILGSSMAFIDSTVVNVALPALQTNLGGSVTDIQWVVEAYGLFLGALILVGGSLGDSLGRRRIFLLGVAVFTGASIACGLSSNIRELIWARAVQGLGAAFLVPGSLSIISASFDEKERGRAIGTWSGFTAITTAIGPVVGGWLIQHASWRWAFFLNVPLAAVVIVLAVWHVPETVSEARGQIDWLGGLIATVGLAALAYGFIESARLGWKDTYVLGGLIIGCIALIGFFFIESRARFPMVPLDLFRSSDFSGANLVTLFLYAALGMFFFLFPLNLIQIQHYSATATGAAALPIILLMFLLSRWSGGLITRYGARRPLIVGPVIAAAGFILFAWPSVGGTYWRTFFPAFVVLGFGMAVSVAPLTTVVMEAVDQRQSGTASGINNAAARVAGLLSVAVLGVAMTAAFGFRLNRSLATLAIPAPALHEIQSNETRLAALEVPAGIDRPKAAAIRMSIDQAFVFGFRLLMLTCAVLALTSAGFAWKLIQAPGRHDRAAPEITGR
jgi:EmrB/QacA subfamily drug resistance transporter